MIVRDAGVGLHEQIADFGILPATEDRFAARQHAGLNGVEISCVTRDLPGAEEQVSRRQGDTAADLVRNLDARLVAVRRLDAAVERVGEPEAARRRNLPGGQKRSRGGRRQSAADGALLKASLQRRDRREEQLRIGERPGARPLRRVEQLADAAGEPVEEHAVAAADDAMRAVRERAAHSRLHVVQILLDDEGRWIRFDVVPQPVGQRETIGGLPVILREESVRAVVQREPRRVRPRRRHVVGPRRADARMARRSDQVRPPEDCRCERLECGERWKDDPRREEQVPSRLVPQIVHVDARLHLMSAGAARHAVGELESSLAVEIDVRRALAHDDEIRELERRLLQHRREIERAARRLESRFVDQRRRQD